MKNQNKIIIAAAIGGAGFLIYKNWDKISKLFGKKEETETPPPVSNEIIKEKPKEKVYSAYEEKVMKLQSNIGAAIDGNAGKSEGSQTNRLTKEFFPNTYARLGAVSPSNIDAYVALGTKREIVDTSEKDNVARSLMIEKAWVGNKKAVIGKRKAHAALVKDNLTNTFQPTSTMLYVNANTILDKSKTIRLSSGYFATDVPAFYSNGNPAVPPVRKVRVSPFDIDII